MNLRVDVVCPGLLVCKQICPVQVWIEHQDDVGEPRPVREHRQVPKYFERHGRIGSVSVSCKHIECMADIMGRLRFERYR